MKHSLALWLTVLTLIGVPPLMAEPTRTLTTAFTYTATVPAPPAGTKALDVWLPIPSDSPWQTVSDLAVDSPVGSQVTQEKQYGDRMVYLHEASPSGPLKVTVSFTVARQAVQVGSGNPDPSFHLPALLTADQRVPVGGRFRQIALGAASGDMTVWDKEHDLFKSVVATMQYDYKKASPKYAQGDSAFVCDYKSGNCSDLHSYLISLSRSIGIPAILEFGFPLTGVPVANPLPKDGAIAGYHCWAWFRDPVQGWTPLDAADARRWTDAGQPEVAAKLFGSLVLERSAVAISRGRDLTLSPPQKAGPLNYFIYPYAEADGQPVKAAWELHYHVIADTAQ